MVQSSFSEIGIIVLTALLSFGMTKWFLSYSVKLGIIDVPNDRSSHTRPTPRGGGIGLVAGLIFAYAIGLGFHWIPAEFAVILVLGGAMAGIGWWDDRSSLSAGFRLAAQLTLATCGVISLLSMVTHTDSIGVFFPASWPLVLSIPFFTLFSVWLTNLYNFMDGIDGIAGLQTATTALSAAVLIGMNQHNAGLEFAYLTLAAAASGFLILNWHPARIFMGDVGSAFIGFLFSLLAIQGELTGALPLSIAVILHGVFISDATLTLITRLLRGQKPHHAHRSHTYQRLVHHHGLSHAKVSLLFGGLNICWLLPIAWAARNGAISPGPAILVAYVPMILFGLKFKAGFPPSSTSHQR